MEKAENSMHPHLQDEILEAIWIAEENQNTRVSDLQVDCQHDIGDYNLAECLDELAGRDLIQLSEGQVTLSVTGRKEARSLIRRHRLAQRLLMDVLDVSEETSHHMACEFEHFLSTEVTDKVDAFLGYPTVDPNNRPIPAAEKPRTMEATVKPVVVRLSRLGVGERSRVAFMTPSFHKRFDRLVAFGLTPGTELLLHQRKPAYVVRLGETELALDEEIAEEVFVRPLG